MIEVFTPSTYAKILKSLTLFLIFFQKKKRETGFLTVPRMIYNVMYYRFMIDVLQ